VAKIFLIEGQFKSGRRRQVFTKEMRALSEKQALERLYSDIGSKHGVKRNLIHVDKIAEINRKTQKSRA
jgi:large subunit ribosomal protein LX